MKKILFIIIFFISTLGSASEIEILNPVLKKNMDGMSMTAIYLTIKNNTEHDMKLLKVNGDFAKNFELHTMTMEKGMMNMRPVEFILVKKGSSTELNSHGLHIMVFDLKSSLVIGKKHKINLQFDNKKELAVDAIVTKI